MDLILHIGHEKTGTTSIQHDLHNNASLLIKSGILYHDRLDNYNLIFALGGQTRAPKDRYERCRYEAAVLLKEIKRRALKHNVGYILISAENLFYINSQQQKKLIASIGIEFRSIKVIAYIRRPADLYLSLMQQRVKADHIIVNPLHFKKNIYQALERWYLLVGEDQISLQAFNKRDLIGGNVVIDFYKRLEAFTGINLGHLPHFDKEMNTSLSSEQMILMQRYRRDFLSDYSGFYHSDSSNILSLFEKIQVSLSNELSMTKPVLKPELDAFISSNNKKFVSDVDSLFNKNFSTIFKKDYSDDIDFKTEMNTSYTEISQILKSYNSQTLEMLFQMLPNYNDGLVFKSDNYSIPSFILEDPKICMYYSRYLFKQGMTYRFTSKYLAEYSLTKALELGLIDKSYYRYLIKVLLLHKKIMRAISVLSKAI